MKQEKSRTGRDAGGGEEPPCLRTNYRPRVGGGNLCESGAPVSGTLDYLGSPSPNCAAGLVGSCRPNREFPTSFGRRWWETKGKPLIVYLQNKQGVCVRVFGEREAYGSATSAWGYLLFGSGIPYLPFHLPGALDGLSLWPWVLAVLTSCFLPALLRPLSSQALNHWAG